MFIKGRLKYYLLEMDGNPIKKNICKVCTHLPVSNIVPTDR